MQAQGEDLQQFMQRITQQLAATQAELDQATVKPRGKRSRSIGRPHCGLSPLAEVSESMSSSASLSAGRENSDNNSSAHSTSAGAAEYKATASSKAAPRFKIVPATNGPIKGRNGARYAGLPPKAPPRKPPRPAVKPAADPASLVSICPTPSPPSERSASGSQQLSRIPACPVSPTRQPLQRSPAWQKASAAPAAPSLDSSRGGISWSINAAEQAAEAAAQGSAASRPAEPDAAHAQPTAPVQTQQRRAGAVRHVSSRPAVVTRSGSATPEAAQQPPQAPALQLQSPGVGEQLAAAEQLQGDLQPAAQPEPGTPGTAGVSQPGATPGSAAQAAGKTPGTQQSGASSSPAPASHPAALLLLDEGEDSRTASCSPWAGPATPSSSKETAGAAGPPAQQQTPPSSGQLSDKPRKGVFDWMSPRRKTSDTSEPAAAPKRTPVKLLFSKIRAKLSRKRSLRSDSEGPTPALSSTAPSAPELPSPSPERAFTAAPAVVGRLTDSPPLPERPADLSRDAELSLAALPEAATSPAPAAQAAQSSSSPGEPAADLSRKASGQGSEHAGLAALCEVSLAELPSPGIKSHALHFSDASLHGSPSPEAASRQLLSRESSAAASPQQPQPELATPSSAGLQAAPPQQQLAQQEAVGDAEADTGTPALGLGPYPTPYFTAQSSWGPSGHVTSSLDTPGSLPPPSPAEEPLGTGFSGGFSTNPLYGQSRSGPPSVRGMKQLLLSDLAPSPMSPLPLMDGSAASEAAASNVAAPPQAGPRPAAGLSELSSLAPMPATGAALVTQASLRAADAAAARQLGRQLSGAASLTPRLRSSLQSEQPGSEPAEQPAPDQHSLAAEQGGAGQSQQPESSTQQASTQPARRRSSEQDQAAEQLAGGWTDRSGGSQTSRSQALQRLKERNLSRAFQSGALSASQALQRLKERNLSRALQSGALSARSLESSSSQTPRLSASVSGALRWDSTDTEPALDSSQSLPAGATSWQPSSARPAARSVPRPSSSSIAEEPDSPLVSPGRRLARQTSPSREAAEGTSSPSSPRPFLRRGSRSTLPATRHDWSQVPSRTSHRLEPHLIAPKNGSLVALPEQEAPNDRIAAHYSPASSPRARRRRSSSTSPSKAALRPTSSGLQAARESSLPSKVASPGRRRARTASQDLTGLEGPLDQILSQLDTFLQTHSTQRA